MATGALLLGNLFDIGTSFAPVDMQTGANTGKRVALKRARSCTFVLFKGVGTGGDDPVLTLQEHNANAAGTSQNLATITKYYKKSEATLDNDEAWTLVTQAAAATATLTGEAALQGIYVFEVNGDSLSDGFTHVSLSVADVGGNAQLGCMLAIVRPVQMRKPENMGNMLTGDLTANV